MFRCLMFQGKFSRRTLFRWVAGIVFSLSVIGFGFQPAWALNGPHAWCIPDDPCGACHLPHHAADDMLWARTPGGEFTGTKRLCSTCHGTHLFGARDYIFVEEGSDHPMGINASSQGPAVTRKDWGKFPLRPKEGGEGFYCGSCHNPHTDPFYIDADNSGDYLREESEGLIQNISQKHYEFCIQCHAPLVHGQAHGHGTKDGCFDCHTPHYSPNRSSKMGKALNRSLVRGKDMPAYYASGSDKKIIKTKNISFISVPNVPGFSDPNAASYAATCYGCHKFQGGGEGALVAPLNADDCDHRFEHHPMGTGADASTQGHQKTAAGPLSPEGELYCGSCHDPHNATNAKYLNPQVIGRYDPAHPGTFCVACHSDKKVRDLESTPGRGHNQVGRNSGQPQNENECLFCHCIHKSPDDPSVFFQTDSDEATMENSSASVDVIMRVAPVNLRWGDKISDGDVRDYEDACYGCHSRTEIVKSKETDNEDNSLLFDNVDDRYFSHRFNVKPTANINIIDPFEDGKPVVSDGIEKKCKNDYGVEKETIWCGSCHNVHRQDSPPAHYSQEFISRRTAYLRYPNVTWEDSGSALCIACHTKNPKPGDSHPVNVPLNQQAVRFGDNFSWYLIAGFSGGIGGQTSNDMVNGDIICQSCHSVHSAVTSHHGISRTGNSNSGKLLIIDNAAGGRFQDQPAYQYGSGLCCNCHYDML
ncbi:MAG: cytochrome c3 family protein [bacterium]